MNVDFNVLEGKTITEITGNVGDDVLIIKCSDGYKYQMSHYQDCCESVYLEDIIGDLSDLIGTPIIRATEDSNSEIINPEEEFDSHTWTFYNISTNKGTVTLRWFGTSNGYYSESVDFELIEEPKENFVFVQVKNEYGLLDMELQYIQDRTFKYTGGNDDYGETISIYFNLIDTYKTIDTEYTMAELLVMDEIGDIVITNIVDSNKSLYKKGDSF